METARLEAEVFSALKNDIEIMELLPKGESSIFHLQAPAVYPDYPILVYSVISDTPVTFGDNKEKFHSVIFRIHIIAEDYSELYSAVKRVMAELDFTRVQATPFFEDKTRMLITDFRIVIGG